MTDKSRRGRPKGTGKKDTQHLSKIADIMVARELKKPTTAMRVYLLQARSTTNFPETDSTLVRRWQVKWKARGDELLTAAREKKLNANRKVTGSDVRNMLSAMNAFHAQLNQMANPLSEIQKFLQPFNALKERVALAQSVHQMIQPLDLIKQHNTYLDSIKKTMEGSGLRSYNIPRSLWDR